MILRPASQSLREVMQRVPVIKLPPSKFEPCLQALTSARHQLRQEVVDNVLSNVYPRLGEDRPRREREKRIFRALVAPALTRLHFARSEPPFYRPAPNARIWNLQKVTSRSYVAVSLFDFAQVRLGMKEDQIPPMRGLRDSARIFGPRLADRVRGLDAMLAFYAPFRQVNHHTILRIADIDHAKPSRRSVLNGLETVLIPGRVTAIDEARYLMMRKLLHEEVLSSSFVVDYLLGRLIQTGKLVPFRSAFAAIDSLIIGGISVNAIARSRGTSRGS